MWWTEQVERLDRRWTVDDSGHHVQFGDLLEDIVDEVAEERNLFSLEAILTAVDSASPAPRTATTARTSACLVCAQH